MPNCYPTESPAHLVEQARRRAVEVGDELCCSYTVLLYGSSATNRRWKGSDVNVMVVADREWHHLPSVTAYLYDDILLPTSRIEKWLVGTTLLQIEVVSRSLLEVSTAFDWIMADRFCDARVLGADNANTVSSLEYLRSVRDTSWVQSHRIMSYVERARARLDSGTTSEDRGINHRVASMYLGYALLELAGRRKQSYKRQPRQLLELASQNDALAVKLMQSTDFITQPCQVVDLLQASETALTRYREFAQELLATAPIDTASTLRSTLSLGSGQLPYGKGIMENIAIGDPSSALDSLRKATLWLVLITCHAHVSTSGGCFDRYSLHSFLRDQVGMPKEMLAFMANLWPPPQADSAKALIQLSDQIALLSAGLGSEAMRNHTANPKVALV